MHFEAKQSQQTIGWQHIICGRFSKSIHAVIRQQLQEQERKQPAKAATQFLTKLTIILWQWTADTWTYRCEAQHGKVEGARITLETESKEGSPNTTNIERS